MISAIPAPGINHLAIGSADPERLARFYEDVLGLRRVHRAEAEGATRAIWLSLGETVLMIERATEGGTPSTWTGGVRPGFHLVAIKIKKDEFDRWENRLSAAGVSLGRKSDYTLYFTDPDGNPLGLSCFDAEEYLKVR